MENKKDFDSVLEDFGEFGIYQKIIIYLVLLPTVIPCAFNAYSQIFMSTKPDYWCKIPGNNNLTFNPGLNVKSKSFLQNENTHQCFISKSDLAGNWSFGSNAEIPCTDGWIFDLSKFHSTVVTEWNLVCDKDFYPSLALILFGIGGAIGNYLFGYIQDLVGRKIVFFFYLFIQCSFGILSGFASSFWIWAILRIGVGFTIPAILVSPSVLAVELVGPKQRTSCMILLNIAYSMGLIALSGVFYLCRDWRQLTFATTFPFVFLFFFWWVMPESPRWLLAKGKLEDCIKILNKMATINKTELPANYLDNLLEMFREDYFIQSKDCQKTYGVMDLFKYPKLRKRTALITFVWFTNTSVYVGLSYYAPDLGSNDFLNFFLAALVELPTYLFLWPAMEKMGRRWTLSASMLIGGFACLATLFSQNGEIFTLCLYCIGKMGISSSFVVLPLMASEIYPTVVRGIGISFSSVVGQIGPIIIPFVNYLGKEWMVLPLLVMGSFLILGSFLSLTLPETLHEHLPQTLKDAETFRYKSERYWPWKK